MDCSTSQPRVELKSGEAPSAMRQPLGSLPAIPLNKRPAPIQISNQALSSLSVVDKSVSTAGSEITPPITPTLYPGTAMSVRTTSPMCEIIRKSPIKPLTYSGTFELQESLGYGAWSTVYRAIPASALPSSTTPPGSLTPLTPPTSPTQAKNNLVLAIKTPSHTGAHAVLHHEARILTYLSTSPSASTFLVPFHGLHVPSHSIVLTAQPLNLATHLATVLAHTAANFTTRTMFDPIIGVAAYSSLAHQLVSGLAWLHAMDCVHGDIKSANILLAPLCSGSTTEPAFPFKPLYCDFSSGHIPSLPSPPAADAITTTYAAPELLTSSSDAPPSTAASDIYALGVTLLVAATGEEPYLVGRSEMHKLAMAKEGRPIDFARMTDQATRIRSGGLVVKVVGGAVAKDVVERWTIEKWVKTVNA